MATISADDIETEARTILRERIERTPWFSYGLTEDERLTMIDQEVDQHWPLMTEEAAVRLINKLAEGSLTHPQTTPEASVPNPSRERTGSEAAKKKRRRSQAL